jgi:hypothetical protein
MWDCTAEPSPADTARRRNPGPQILRRGGMVFFVIEPKDPSRVTCNKVPQGEV